MENKVWLIGDGRSGTTWVSNLINYDNYFKEVFEPFHPFLIPQMNFLRSHYYARPGIRNERLYDAIKLVFSGNFQHPRTDSNNSIIKYNGLLVKDIFANLFAKFVQENFEDIKIILLIRNPFAVALSKFHKKHWHWINDPIKLFNQIDLKNDYLSDYEDIILKVSEKNDFILNQILIWSIIYFIPLQQFKSQQIYIMFYENIVTNPSYEIIKLTNFIDKKFDNLPQDVIEKHSKVVGLNILNGTSPINSWMSELDSRKIDQGFKILERFGLDNLYDQKSFPNNFNLDNY